MEAIVGRTTPFTSGELLETMERESPGIGRATIFRTLDLLARLGIVQRIHSGPDGGRCHAYLACDDTHHHHLICSKCGLVTDFTEDKEMDELVRKIERRTAFQIEGHRLELTGRCPACQR